MGILNKLPIVVSLVPIFSVCDVSIASEPAIQPRAVRTIPWGRDGKPVSENKEPLQELEMGPHEIKAGRTPHVERPAPTPTSRPTQPEVYPVELEGERPTPIQRVDQQVEQCDFNSRLYRAKPGNPDLAGQYHELQFVDGFTSGIATITEYREGRAVWRATGEHACSNGAAICRLLFPMTSGEVSDAPFEALTDEQGDYKTIVVPAFSQNVYLSERYATLHHGKSYGGLVADFLNGFTPKEGDLLLPRNVYEFAGCARAEASERLPTEDEKNAVDEGTPLWEFGDQGVYAIGDKSRSLFLGGEFSRRTSEHFLGGSFVSFVETEEEDCTYCQYINIDESNSIFIESGDRKTIRYIQAYGDSFIDIYTKISGRKLKSGDTFYCIIQALDEYEACQPRFGSKLSYIINREGCSYKPSFSFDEIKKYRASGCEIVYGFEFRSGL